MPPRNANIRVLVLQIFFFFKITSFPTRDAFVSTERIAEVAGMEAYTVSSFKTISYPCYDHPCSMDFKRGMLRKKLNLTLVRRHQPEGISLLCTAVKGEPMIHGSNSHVTTRDRFLCRICLWCFTARKLTLEGTHSHRHTLDGRVVTYLHSGDHADVISIAEVKVICLVIMITASLIYLTIFSHADTTHTNVHKV